MEGLRIDENYPTTQQVLINMDELVGDVWSLALAANASW
jgi:hypothetical protein